MASMLEQRTIGNYLIGRTLGSGMSGKVRLGSNIHSGEQVALKLIRKDRLTNRQMEMVDREITAMNEMKHPNTVKLLDHSLDATYTKKNGTQYQVVLLVVELAAEGEIFDYIMHTGPFSEDMARTYAVQFLGALESCHAQGIFHRDLKPGILPLLLEVSIYKRYELDFPSLIRLFCKDIFQSGCLVPISF
eukprot:CAMPEP_0117785108 /NCGR_PEP_ID=MMETSP0948-20121206/5071_1 /TAXON_ID=44440 /ORGANISM="Chattonella subsalsa, Strain CCMP2191" /LENGTH=189 /DNA_ID=CAMNT_0005613919 /DNA_START=142 /DNA_END=711 /DNA_ORIENTATION=-